MKMKKILRNFLAVGVAVSFVMNSTVAVMATEGVETVADDLGTEPQAEQEKAYLQFEGMDNYVEVELGSTLPLMDYHGNVPEGKVFTGWTIGGTEYAAGAAFTFSKDKAADMGTDENGVHGYVFSFKAVFADAEVKETGYLQFEGMDNYVEVELGSTLPLMDYHGDVPEGQVFTGWTIGGTEYAAGAEFTFSKDKAVDMGTDNGVHGYLFSFKAVFADAVKEAGYIQFEGLDNYVEVELGTTLQLMSNYHGNVPEGKVFAGWTIGGTEYAPGAEFTFSKENASDMGTDENGVHGYLFSFKAAFADAVKEAGYIQFEGLDNYVEVELGTTLQLMSNYHGNVPEGKVFAGWTIGGTEYAPGAEFTFSKENASDMGTDENGVHGYLFSFKAAFADKEAGYIQFEGLDNYVEVELGTTLQLMSNYHGNVPEGKVFAGWTIGGTEYAPGAEFTFSKENAADMGTDENGVHGYLFSFKAAFKDAVKEVGYIQFEGMDNYVEVELGSTLQLMNYHGDVPEGKVFAGWAIGDAKYAAGADFTFSKENAADMGTDENGVHGYLFSFKATFEDAVKEVGYIQFEGMDNYVEVELGRTLQLMNYHGDVPEGKAFAGWVIGDAKYAAGADFTFSKENAADMGTDENGVRGYLFSFKATFVDVVKEVGYIQFEGLDNYVEVELGAVLQLMSNFHGTVPEGKVFAGWTVGETECAPGAEFTFSKENAVDMGTNEDGIHGYLFSFKARFEDAEVETETEAPQTETEAPQTETEAPQTETEAPQTETEAPQTETDAPQTDAPQTDAPQTDAPQTEEETEAPQTDEEETEDQDVEETEEEETEEEKTTASKDDKKDNNSSDKKDQKSNAVQTGDNTMIMPYVISLLAAFAVFAAILLKRRNSTH